MKGERKRLRGRREGRGRPVYSTVRKLPILVYIALGHICIYGFYSW